MNTLIQGYLAPKNDFQLNRCSNSVFSQENHVFRHKPTGFHDLSLSPLDESSSGEICVATNGSSSSVDDCSSEGESFKENDHSDEILKFISTMLMEEEDLENKPCMLNDCLALQATEKSLYDVLNNNYDDENGESSVDVSSSLSFSDFTNFLDSNSELLFFNPSKISPISPSRVPNHSSSKRQHSDFIELEEQRSNKMLANTLGESESEPLEMYDKVLLCPNSDNPLMSANKLHLKMHAKGSTRGRPKGSKKQGVIKEVVDLRSLLMQCAQAVASYDTTTVNNLLLRIRQHSSPNGDGTERLAHYFANALEARLAGVGIASAFSSMKISAAEILRAYQTFITACPFRKMSNVLANRTIRKLADKATTLHIIDFGILYGFQWPCLIQALHERPGGPPKLRITGIDFPQPGFRPTDRVGDTGRRLAKYCERFGVPFEYNAIAQKWETIKLEDLKIEKHELLVVNSLYRLQNVPDETVMVNSPRDAVLNLIKKINPDMFIHGVVNGTYNTPFFLTRFRETLFHFSSFFDMFETTIPREDPNRVRFEEEVFGKDAMNIIACEGAERINRPESYKQWQVRNVRAGFRQMPLDQDLVKFVRNKVKTDYHKDFSVDEDGKWMLQGWKGRVLHAISYWQPANKSNFETTDHV